ncbi:cytosolic sulfotransferase 12 isoform X4 [Elaeis guineensis]|uniref:cytosolic sulfotransferase 12 isoform X4 n=1 Tax=Elaeis guineensis var. tenera TaxID=51953 RepID=UPI00094FEFE9
MDSPLLLSSVPSGAQQDEEDHDPIKDLTVQEQSNLISSLPKREGWMRVLRRYQGFWISDVAIPRLMAIQAHFKPRPTDVILVTQPKAGTTWLKALAFAIVNRSNYSFSQHPLLSRNPHECVPFIDLPYVGGHAADYKSLAQPRLLATHIPYSLLPASVADSDCRLVYLCRDPKDVLVSLWHFMKAMKPEIMELSPAFEMFCDGATPYGPVWEHNLEYWRESLRRPEKVLFLKYEEIVAEPMRSVKSLAEFMGCPFSEEEERDGAVEEVVRLCSFEKLSSMEVNKRGVGLMGGVTIQQANFFRKGKVGDWVNHLSRDMAERLDRLVHEKLNGSGLTFQLERAPIRVDPLIIWRLTYLGEIMA